MILTVINPEDFRVARVISFRDEISKISGVVSYMRPFTTDYNQSTLDDFDHSMIRWMESLNLNNVRFTHSEDILFDYQIPQLSRIYNCGRPSSKLNLICHGDYSPEEFISMGQIYATCIELNVFWDTIKKDTLPQLSRTVTFDKNKEKYYFDVIGSLSGL